MNSTAKYERKNATYLFKYLLLANFLQYLEAGAVPALLLQLSESFQMNAGQQGLLGGVVYLSLSLGGPFAGYLLRNYEHKAVILCAVIINLILTFIWSMTPVNKSYSNRMFITVRFLMGFCQCIVCVFLPLWTNENAPKDQRTSWMSYLQASVPFGVMMGYIIASITITLSHGSHNGMCFHILCWRWPFLIQIILLVPLIVGLFLVPKEDIAVAIHISNKSHSTTNKKLTMTPLGSSVLNTSIQPEGNDGMTMHHIDTFQEHGSLSKPFETVLSPMDNNANNHMNVPTIRSPLHYEGSPIHHHHTHNWRKADTAKSREQRDLRKTSMSASMYDSMSAINVIKKSTDDLPCLVNSDLSTILPGYQWKRSASDDVLPTENAGEPIGYEINTPMSEVDVNTQPNTSVTKPSVETQKKEVKAHSEAPRLINFSTVFEISPLATHRSLDTHDYISHRSVNPNEFPPFVNKRDNENINDMVDYKKNSLMVTKKKPLRLSNLRKSWPFNSSLLQKGISALYPNRKTAINQTSETNFDSQNHNPTGKLSILQTIHPELSNKSLKSNQNPETWREKSKPSIKYSLSEVASMKMDPSTQSSQSGHEFYEINPSFYTVDRTRSLDTITARRSKMDRKKKVRRVNRDDKVEKATIQPMSVATKVWSYESLSDVSIHENSLLEIETADRPNVFSHLSPYNRSQLSLDGNAPNSLTNRKRACSYNSSIHSSVNNSPLHQNDSQPHYSFLLENNDHFDPFTHSNNSSNNNNSTHWKDIVEEAPMIETPAIISSNTTTSPITIDDTSEEKKDQKTKHPQELEEIELNSKSVDRIDASTPLESRVIINSVQIAPPILSSPFSFFSKPKQSKEYQRCGYHSDRSRSSDPQCDSDDEEWSMLATPEFKIAYEAESFVNQNDIDHSKVNSQRLDRNGKINHSDNLERIQLNYEIDDEENNYVDKNSVKYRSMKPNAANQRSSGGYGSIEKYRSNMLQTEERRVDVTPILVVGSPSATSIFAATVRSSIYYQKIWKAIIGMYKVLQSIKALLSIKVYRNVLGAMTALYFIVTGVQYWGTKYLSTVLHAPLPLVSLLFVLCAATGPTLGVFFGGWLIDLSGGYRGPRQRVIALEICSLFGLLGFLFAIPITLFDNIFIVISFLWLVLFFGGSILPACSGIIVSIVPRRYRPTSSSLSLVCFNLFGYFLSLFLSGYIMQFLELYSSYCDYICSMTWGFRLILSWSTISLGFLLNALLSSYEVLKARDR